MVKQKRHGGNLFGELIKKLTPFDWSLIASSIAQYIIADYLKKDDMIFILESVRGYDYEFDDDTEQNQAIDELIKLIDQGPVSQKYSLAVDFIEIADLEDFSKHFYIPSVMNLMRYYRFLQSAWKDYSDLIAHMLYVCIGADEEKLSQLIGMKGKAIYSSIQKPKDINEALRFARKKDVDTINDIQYSEIKNDKGQKIIPVDINQKTFIETNLDRIVERIKTASQMDYEYLENVTNTNGKVNEFKDNNLDCIDFKIGYKRKESQQVGLEKLNVANGIQNHIEIACHTTFDEKYQRNIYKLNDKLSAILKKMTNREELLLKSIQSNIEGQEVQNYVIELRNIVETKTQIYAVLDNIMLALSYNTYDNPVISMLSMFIKMYEEVTEVMLDVGLQKEMSSFNDKITVKSALLGLLRGIVYPLAWFGDSTSIVDTKAAFENFGIWLTTNGETLVQLALKIAGKNKLCFPTLENKRAFIEKVGRNVSLMLDVALRTYAELREMKLSEKDAGNAKAQEKLVKIHKFFLQVIKVLDLIEKAFNPSGSSNRYFHAKAQANSNAMLISNDESKREEFVKAKINANAKSNAKAPPMYEILNIKTLPVHTFEFKTNDASYVCFDKKGDSLNKGNIHAKLSKVVTLRSYEKDVNKVIKSLADRVNKTQNTYNMFISVTAGQEDIQMISTGVKKGQTGFEDAIVKGSKKWSSDQTKNFKTYYETIINKVFPPETKTFRNTFKGMFTKSKASSKNKIDNVYNIDEISKELKNAIETKIQDYNTSFEPGKFTKFINFIKSIPSLLKSKLKEYFNKESAYVYMVWLVTDSAVISEEYEYYVVNDLKFDDTGCVHVNLVPNKGMICTNESVGINKDTLNNSFVKVLRVDNNQKSVYKVEWIWGKDKIHDITRFVNKELSNGTGNLVFKGLDKNQSPGTPQTPLVFAIPLLKSYQV